MFTFPETHPAIAAGFMKVEFMFGFVGGGWNTVFATDVNTAKTLIKNKYDNGSTLIPNYDTVKPVKGNEEAYNFALKAFD